MRLSFQPQIVPDTTHLINFFGDPPACKRRTLSCVLNAVNFFPLHPSMKPRDLHNYHNFQTLYAIFGFFRTSVHTLVIKFPDKDASTFLSSFADTASVWIQVHEYQISIH